jgi:hypothetical protein
MLRGRLHFIEDDLAVFGTQLALDVWLAQQVEEVVPLILTYTVSNARHP